MGEDLPYDLADTNMKMQAYLLARKRRAMIHWKNFRAMQKLGLKLVL